MELQHVYAVFTRHIFMMKHDFNRLLISLYWPLLDILIWGFLGSWIQQGQQTPGLNAILLTAVLLWIMVGRMSSEIQF